MAKCSFHKFGPSGTTERHDGLCVLPLNIINEKIYIFLWFWFIIVASITGIFLIYRIAVLFGSGIRTAMIQVTHLYIKHFLSMHKCISLSFLFQARAGRIGRDKIVDILSDPNLNSVQQLGDFFLLYLIAKNMDEVRVDKIYDEHIENICCVDQVGVRELISELHTALRPAYSNAPTLKASSKNNSAVE